MTSVLVVAAHPDDEVLGCGGTVARLSPTDQVHVLILGEGVTSRFPSPELADRAEVERLKTAARSAGAILAVQTVRLGDLPDNRFDELPLLEIVKCVEQVVDEIRPTVVYTHHPGDLNIDHRLTFQAVLTATRPTPSCPVRELYTFEIPSSTEWAFQQLQPPFKPNVFVDVSGTIETKLKAMAQYEGECRAFPHPRSIGALRAIARRWGAVIGVEFAEAFELVRWIRT